MRNFIRFLKSKSFRVNFAIAFVSITLLLFLVLKWLGVYTKHGETISVPDLKGIDIVEVIDIDENQELAMDYGIRGVPTLVMIDGDIEVKRFSGMKMKNEIETWLGA